MIKVLITDDSPVVSGYLKYIFSSDPEMEVVGTASNGEEAVALVRELKPDVVTMDIHMPRMDGFEATRQIMETTPVPIVICSASWNPEEVDKTFRTMEAGAVAALEKPQGMAHPDSQQSVQELVKTVKSMYGIKLVRRWNRARKKETPPPQETGNAIRSTKRSVDSTPSLPSKGVRVIAVGASTGGPPVLETILSSLPAAFDTPIVIAQHMPEVFTKSMAKRLDDLCGQRVVHAESGMPIHKGWVFLAPGGRHTHVEKTRLAHYHIRVGDDPETAVYRPSVDALLSSAARATASRSLGVVLTGIGDDGVNGARAIHAAGGTILHQSEPTCVVYGMPKAVAGANISTAALSPADVGRALAALAGGTAAAA